MTPILRSDRCSLTPHRLCTCSSMHVCSDATMRRPSNRMRSCCKSAALFFSVAVCHVQQLASSSIFSLPMTYVDMTYARSPGFFMSCSMVEATYSTAASCISSPRCWCGNNGVPKPNQAAAISISFGPCSQRAIAVLMRTVCVTAGVRAGCACLEWERVLRVAVCGVLQSACSLVSAA